MFFNNFVKRRLSSLLRPWLEQDPELDLQLGLISSIAIAQNLRLDTSALNRELVDGSSSPRFIFKEFVIEEFVVRFSNWSATAFTFEARGIKVTLSYEEMEKEGTGKVRKSSNAAFESMKKDLSMIDPKGSALHDILEAILATTCRRNRVKSSFLNLILQHCRLQILGINLQVQVPTLNESFAYLLELEEFNAESLQFVHGCLCRGLAHVLFLPLKEGSLVTNCSCFKIGYKESNQINHICSSGTLSACIKLYDFKLAEFTLRIPELSFLFSPVDFPVFMALSKVFSKESKRVRNGRYLWRLAAIKVGHVILAPKLSWYKLVGLTILWLHYVNHYEYLLSLIRYCADHLLERSDIKMPRDKVILTSAKHYWEVISDIEKELPAEAIAQARTIARNKAVSSGQHSQDNHRELFVNSCFKTFVWKVMQRIFQSTACLFYLRKSSTQDEQFVGHLGNVSESSYSRLRFILSVGKIYINLSSMSGVQTVREKSESHIGISYSDVFSFRFSIKVLLLMYIEDIFEQTLSFSCGKLKVKYFISSVGGEKERVKNLKNILHGEPAKIFLLSESNRTSAVSHADGGCDPCLERFIGEMCLNWRRACKQFEETEIKCPENPRLLFEMKSFLRHPDLKKLGSGLWKCNLTVGKFNIALGYLSILSVVMLLRQIQHALNWTQGNGRARDLSYSPRTTEHQPDVSWEKKYECYSSKIKMCLLRMLPGKDIQIGVLVAGPHIQLSSRKIGARSVNEGVNSHVDSGNDFHLGFDICDIEVVVWPTSKSDLAPIHTCTEQDDEDPECLRLQELKILDILKLENTKYASKDGNSLRFYLRLNGLQAYFEDMVEKQKNQIFVLDPLTFQFSSFRECVHSFSTTSIAFSTAFYGLAMGFTILLFFDELYARIQVLTGLFSDLSHPFHNFGFPGNKSVHMFRTQDMVSGVTEDEELNTKATPLIYNNTLFLINGIFKLKSVDIFLCNSGICNKERSSKIGLDAGSSNNSAANYLSDCSIWISFHQICFDILLEERKLELLIDLSGIQSVIVRYQDYIRKSVNRPAFREFVLCAENCLYEVSLSHCIFTLLSSLPQISSSSTSVNERLDASTSEANASYAVVDTSFSSEREPSFQSSDFLQKLGFTSNIQVPSSSHWIFINVVVAEVFMTRCPVKNILVGAQKFNKLLSSLYVGAEFQTIAWGIQGGFLCLETTALAMFVQCFASYIHRLKNVIGIVQSTAKHMQRAEHDDNRPVGGHAQEMPLTSQQGKRQLPEAFNLDLSQFSLVLVESESSHIQEFLLELDLILNLDMANMRRKFMFKLSRLSIFSQVIQQNAEDEIQILHFSSAQSNELSSHLISGESALAFQHEDGSFLVDDSCSRGPVSPGAFCLHHQDCILNHLTASFLVEKAEVSPLDPKQVWVGSGSVSGFDMTISLSELQMILSMVSSFSGLSGKGSSGEFVQRNWPYNQQDDNNFEERIPDGAIVAIQDVHQHLYIMVEGGENQYSIRGAVHYSLVGERALFRVKYQKQKWNSSALLFSLISLHAKNNSGEPLRLNSYPGSGFVELSSTTNNSWALWSILSCKPETYEGDIDWEPYNQVLRNTFYLVNKKNGCAVAFSDTVPVFVRKRGNPFKFKVFSDMSVAQDVVTYSTYPLNSSGTEVNQSAHEDGESYWQSRNLPCIDITIDKVALTVVHELSDSNDRFPLLHGCINGTQLTLQIQSTKARVVCTSKALLQYFDAQTNSWRDFLRPVEICIFYRSRFQNPHGVPVHVYCRTKELEISLTELSLDILLFVIGKLNLAGPFTVRSSMILANCGKVENQTGLNLLCHFYGKQSVTVGRKQSASFSLRLSAFENQPPEAAAVVSIQLSLPGSFTTSPIHLSLLRAQTLAWRTRLVSLKDSKSYPGPFVVVDVSRKSEDGLSISVSPLIRIHNETKFSIELRISRPEPIEDEFASVSLKAGDTFDDSMASFDAINFSGGFRKAVMSLNVGNFLFSFRPEISNDLMHSDSPLSVEWSDEIKGGKAIHLSGIFDKLSYKVRKALSIGSVKCSFSTTYCTIKSAAAHLSDVHFLIQSIGREVPIMKPDKSKDELQNRHEPISLQEEKEVFILPTVRVTNLLHSEIHVLLTETNLRTPTGHDNIGKEATLPCGSTVDFYANPAIMYLFVTLTAFSSTCKPVNSGEWVKKLLKHKNDVPCLDIDLDFGGGKYFASIRLSRGYKGILEATVYTPYTLKNDTDISLFFFTPGQKPSFRNEMGSVRPEFGLVLPPKSTGSWFLKSRKMRLRLLEDHASETQIDLDALSGPTEVSLEIEKRSGVKYIAKFGVSMGPTLSRVVPSQMITMAPRHVVLNESEETITVRQCNLEVDIDGMISINSRQRRTLWLQTEISKRREYSLFENFIKKHRNDSDSSLIYIQFQLNESQLDWSGPLCITSLGCFFLKFRKQSNQLTIEDKRIVEFAAVHVVEEGSTIVVRFQKPPNGKLPYRIENHLHGVSLTYFQKNSSEPEFLGSECSVDYTWDDVTLPHKLVVVINDMNLPREINLDKVRTWKPFYKLTQERLASHMLLDKKSKGRRSNLGDLKGMNAVKVGYEVYADGPTRVLRICEFSDIHKQNKASHSCAKIRMRVSQFAIQLLEQGKEDLNQSSTPSYTPVVVARLQNICLDSVFTDQQKYNQIVVQSLNVDVKWMGAPFVSMLRGHQLDYSDANDSILKIVFVLLSAGTDVKQVKYSSVILQPIDLNVDEDTLMKIVSFWRRSLSDSNAPSQQFYFDHFEIHPIKIIASFVPGESYSSYNSAQEALRSLLHSVVKVPPIKKMVVELNGVSITHALVTIRELLIRCAQHYSWYTMRAISIAKGSQLLPPAFASIFDDLASSSLDIFFDPSQGLMNLPGIKWGTFKFISKCIHGKGFSGTKRYFGDLGTTLRKAGSNVVFAAVTEISDSVLKGAETSGFDGMVSGFHQGILKLAMEPSVLSTALMGGGPERKIKLDRSPGVDELYIEGYLQAMLDTMYRQEYLRVRVLDDQVILKNLPPSKSLTNEIMDRVKGFLISKALLKGDPSAASRPMRNVQGESEWRIGPTIVTLCEHLFVSFAIRKLRKQADKYIRSIKWKKESESDDLKAIIPANAGEEQNVRFVWKWGIAKFVLSGILAYIDGRLCRCIPNPVARRIVSGFLLSFLDQNNG